MRQIFYNYYAYNDGSSEAGWGVRGTEFAQVAYKYTTLKEDVLKSILLYCNNTLIADIPTFSLCVWADNNGKPGELLLKQPGMRTYYDKGINGFSLYRLDTSYIIKNKSLKFNGSFFIGWEQPKDFLMNIGVDMNKTLSKKTLFYKTNMVWTESLIENPIMIRPVFDNNTEVYNTIQTPSKNEATVYPNPASRAVSIVLPSGVNPENVTITISNATGYVAYRGTFTPEIGLENLLPGVYFISITDNTTIFDTRKLVINSSY
jgi:hypothetical protein